MDEEYIDETFCDERVFMELSNGTQLIGTILIAERGVVKISDSAPNMIEHVAVSSIVRIRKL